MQQCLNVLVTLNTFISPKADVIKQLKKEKMIKNAMQCNNNNTQ